MSIHGVVITIMVSSMLLCMPSRAEDNSKYRGRPVRLLALMLVEDAAFHVYDPPYEAKAIYSILDEAKCLTPESLMESIRSEFNQEWVDYNIMPGNQSHTVSQEAFERRKQLDKNENYFKLLHKLSFSYNGIPTAIVKYVFVEDGKDGIIASLVAQNIDGRWYQTSILGVDQMEAVVRMLDSDKFKVVSGLEMVDDEEDMVAQIKQKSTDQGMLNTETLFKYLMKLRDEKDMETLSVITGRDLRRGQGQSKNAD